jgi:tetratricopeptide (TPR) repeat protein
LAPANFDTNVGYGGFLNTVGRPTEAIDYFQRCMRMEPLSSVLYNQLGWAYEFSGNIDAATMTMKKGKELNNLSLYSSNLMVLALEENNRALIKEYAVLVVNSDILGINRSDTRHINEVMPALLDTPEKAGAELRLFLTDPAYNNTLRRSAIAVWASYFGEHELALQACRETIGSNLDTVMIIWRPIHKGMRQLPGFKDLVRDLGLVDYWRKSGNWGDFCHPVGADDFECD